MLRVTSILLLLLPLNVCSFTVKTLKVSGLTNNVVENTIARPFHGQTVSLQMAGSKEEEIAALEEKLRQLKEESDETVEEEEMKWEITPEDSSNGSNYLGRLTPNVQTPMGEMLSESWKEGNKASTSNGNSFLDGAKNVVGALIFVAVLALASQIPVGQEDFSKYSYKEAASPATTIDLGDLNPVKSVKDTVFSADDLASPNSDASPDGSTD